MADVFLNIYLQPRASKNEIIGPYRDGIKVRVTAPPVEGKANEALVQFISRALNLAPSQIQILAGHHSRGKRIKISGVRNRESVKERLGIKG